MPPSEPPSVYPRVCGGTTVPPRHALEQKGLSPRVRGNLAREAQRIAEARSIPACAGEPVPARLPPPAPEVYPRVCGGTLPQLPQLPPRGGLSPRVRGNPASDAARRGASWSIPACAGEPCSCWPCWASRRVYPRVCGGTTISPAPRITLEGLSPRVRGNRAERRQPPHPERSIPACAGEPAFPHFQNAADEVYPRVCGGTISLTPRLAHCHGLSPRVRGNYLQARPRQRGGRSIPACAGEPTRPARRPRPGRVYPRVCGGTEVTYRAYVTAYGLSPRVRGNRLS